MPLSDVDEARLIAAHAEDLCKRNGERLDDLRERFAMANTAAESLLKWHAERHGGHDRAILSTKDEISELRAELARLQGISEGRGENQGGKEGPGDSIKSNGKAVQVIVSLVALLGLVINYLLDAL